MDYKFLILGVIVCFSCIQLIEVMSFIARISGVKENKRSLAYSLQNAIFMLTRFFTLALMPLLGFLIDQGINKNYYLIMVLSSLLGGALLASLAYILKEKNICVFSKVINNISNGSSVFKEILSFPIYFFKDKNPGKKIKVKYYKDIFLSSAIVFSIYSLSVFMVFYIALFFPDYRTMISQLSGVTNALATVLLTFFIEPKISRTIDNNINTKSSVDMLFSLILGRVFGVGVISSIFILFFLILN